MSRDQILAGGEAKGLQVGKLIPASSLKLLWDLGSCFFFLFVPLNRNVGFR